MRGDYDLPAGPDGPFPGPKLSEETLPHALLAGVAQVLLALEARAITRGQACRLLGLDAGEVTLLRDGVVGLVKREARRLDEHRPAA